MTRRLPADYLRREAVISRGVREHDEQAVMTGMRGLGYLADGADDVDGGLLLEYMASVSWWMQAEDPLRLAPEDVWRGTEMLREQDGRRHLEQLRRMKLPPEALLLRRMEGLLFQTAATLRAGVAWGPLFRELIEEAEPYGELGAEHAAWLRRHHHRRGGAVASA